MSEPDSRFDARMRGVFANVATSPGFDARVMRRIAAAGSAPVVDLREQFERKRALARRRLRREAWSNAVTITGIGAAAGVLLSRHAPAIMQWARSGGLTDIDPWFFTAVIVAALAGCLWPLLRRLTTPL